MECAASLAKENSAERRGLTDTSAVSMHFKSERGGSLVFSRFSIQYSAKHRIVTLLGHSYGGSPKGLRWKPERRTAFVFASAVRLKRSGICAESGRTLPCILGKGSAPLSAPSQQPSQTVKISLLSKGCLIFCRFFEQSDARLTWINSTSNP